MQYLIANGHGVRDVMGYTPRQLKAWTLAAGRVSGQMAADTAMMQFANQLPALAGGKKGGK